MSGELLPVKNCLRYWEDKLKDKGLLDVTTVVIIEATVQHLTKLQHMEGRYENEVDAAGMEGMPQ